MKRIAAAVTLVAVVSCVAMVHSDANADLVTFDFNSADSSLNVISKTVSGLTITLSNPSPSNVFGADADGLFVLASGTISTDTFDMSFSDPVVLDSYNVGFVQDLDGDETITLFSGASTSLEDSPFAVGSRNFANQFTVAAGQTMTVTAGGNEPGDLIQWNQLTVDTTAIPEPSAAVLLGLGLVCLLARRSVCCWR